MDSEIIWTPSDSRKQASAMWRFAERTSDQHGAAPDDAEALLDWSIQQPDTFHAALWDELDIIGDKGTAAFIPGKTMREAQFYPGARLNYAENLLREPDSRLAIIAHRDDGTRRTITRKVLHAEVSRMVSALRAEGVGEGEDEQDGDLGPGVLQSGGNHFPRESEVDRRGVEREPGDTDGRGQPRAPSEVRPARARQPDLTGEEIQRQGTVGEQGRGGRELEAEIDPRAAGEGLVEGDLLLVERAGVE